LDRVPTPTLSDRSTIMMTPTSTIRVDEEEKNPDYEDTKNLTQEEIYKAIKIRRELAPRGLDDEIFVKGSKITSINL
jgi:hypothetical protein